MNKIDQALVNLRENVDSPKKQSAFYDLFLNSTFFVPVTGDGEAREDGSKDVTPVITEADGNDYLMIFDSLERLQAWTQGDDQVRHLEVPGHVLALSTTGELHWALNVGTEYTKQFLPNEIAWLRDAVERCNAEAAAQEAEQS